MIPGSPSCRCCCLSKRQCLPGYELPRPCFLPGYELRRRGCLLGFWPLRPCSVLRFWLQRRCFSLDRWLAKLRCAPDLWPATRRSLLDQHLGMRALALAAHPGQRIGSTGSPAKRDGRKPEPGCRRVSRRSLRQARFCLLFSLESPISKNLIKEFDPHDLSCCEHVAALKSVTGSTVALGFVVLRDVSVRGKRATKWRL
jgi:hypothetical protein